MNKQMKDTKIDNILEDIISKEELARNTLARNSKKKNTSLERRHSIDKNFSENEEVKDKLDNDNSLINPPAKKRDKKSMFKNSAEDLSNEMLKMQIKYHSKRQCISIANMKYLWQTKKQKEDINMFLSDLYKPTKNKKFIEKLQNEVSILHYSKHYFQFISGTKDINKTEEFILPASTDPPAYETTKQNDTQIQKTPIQSSTSLVINKNDSNLPSNSQPTIVSTLVAPIPSPRNQSKNLDILKTPALVNKPSVTGNLKKGSKKRKKQDKKPSINYEQPREFKRIQCQNQEPDGSDLEIDFYGSLPLPSDKLASLQYTEVYAQDYNTVMKKVTGDPPFYTQTKEYTVETSLLKSLGRISLLTNPNSHKVHGTAKFEFTRRAKVDMAVMA
jgi:hypothetical protein